LKRYNGSKLERARDLFEQCLEGCPPKFAKSFYLLYAKCEEEYGLAKHAMAIYDRATKSVLPEEQFEMFNIFIKKAAEMFGLTYTRQIYEKAIEVLTDSQAREMCLRFADLERKLGEIDRARAIYAHCSQMCDPRTTQLFWNTWKEFELKHGNEDTIREMLRIKRSVTATFNTQVNFMSAQMMAAVNATQENSDPNKMNELENAVNTMTSETNNNIAPKSSVQFVRSNIQLNQESVDLPKTANPDEININDEEEDDEEEENPVIKVKGL
jgi:pre-mRNA-splicing factor SYF1